MPRRPAYVGSASCGGCHGGIEAGWAPSDHGLAWTLPSEATVLGDVADASFESKGVVTRVTRRGDAFVVETDGKSYDVVGVVGVRPLQQYLLSPEPGRTQASRARPGWHRCSCTPRTRRRIRGALRPAGPRRSDGSASSKPGFRGLSARPLLERTEN